MPGLGPYEETHERRKSSGRDAVLKLWISTAAEDTDPAGTATSPGRLIGVILTQRLPL